MRRIEKLDRPIGEARAWQTLARTELARNPWRGFVRERVRTHLGDEIDYTFVEAPDAAVVVPQLTDGRVVLVRQYRHPVRGWVVEAPAGGVVDADPAEVARQELLEEVGGVAAQIRPLGRYFAAAGHINFRYHAFLATGVVLGARALEATELLEPVIVDVPTALDWARTGAIGDMASALAVLLSEPHWR